MEHESMCSYEQASWTPDTYVDTTSTEYPIMTSTSFFRGARGKDTNIVFCSSDCVHFFVESDSIFAISVNAFKEELTGLDLNYQDAHLFGPTIVFIPEPSSVLNIILHFLHNLAFLNVPTFQTFIDGISAMSRHSIDPKLLLIPSNPCYSHILLFAPAHPLEVYALAARLGLYPLAAASSSYLLSYCIKDISDEMAVFMGPVYLNRLAALHSHRLEMLKSIMMSVPRLHPSTKDCDFLRQKQLTRAWRMTAGHYIWERKCDVSAATIQSSFDTLKTFIACEQCRKMLDNRVKEVLSKWVLVRRTI